MSSSLDLSLPEAPHPRHKFTLVPLITLLLCCAVLSLVLRQQFGEADSSSHSGATTAKEETERLEKLAEDLERRTLYLAAAEVWKEYIDVSTLTAERRSEVTYRRGKCLQSGGDYSGAARCFSEVQRLPLSDDRKRRSRQFLLECLSALGKEVARESVARSFAIRDADAEAKAIAVVGGDPVTRDDLVSEFQMATRTALKMQGHPIPPAELEKQSAAIATERLKNTEAARQALQQIILRQTLYREGLERGYAQDRELGREVERFRRDSIASRVVDDELAKAIAGIGPTDLANHYEANKAKYVNKASTQFSHVSFADAASAAKAVTANASDANLAWESSSAPFHEGAPVPGIGPNAEIAAHLTALAEGEQSRRAFAHAGRHYIFRCEKKTPEQQLSFDAAKNQVHRDLAAIKRQETLAALEESFRQKYFVQIYDKNLAALQNATDPSSTTQENEAQETQNP